MCTAQIDDFQTLFLTYPGLYDRIPLTLESLIESCGSEVCQDVGIIKVVAEACAHLSDLAIDKVQKNSTDFQSALTWFDLHSKLAVQNICPNLHMIPESFKSMLKSMKLKPSVKTSEPTQPFRYGFSFRLPYTPMIIEASGTADLQVKLSDS